MTSLKFHQRRKRIILAVIMATVFEMYNFKNPHSNWSRDIESSV